MEEENIYQRLAKIRKQVSIIQKNSRGFKYNYTKEEDILVRISGLMDKYNVSLIPCINDKSIHVEREHIVKTRFDKTGSAYEEHSDEYKVHADMVYKWINNDNPEDRVEVPWVMVATMADAAQAFGSALTYSSRYFLLKFFNIANSNDDPDALRTKQMEALQAEEDDINASILMKVDAELKDYLTSFPDERDEMKKLVSKYVRGGNYKNIKDSALSSKLLQEIRDRVAAKKGDN